LEDNLVWKIVNSLEIHQMELLMNDLDIVWCVFKNANKIQDLNKEKIHHWHFSLSLSLEWFDIHWCGLISKQDCWSIKKIFVRITRELWRWTEFVHMMTITVSCRFDHKQFANETRAFIEKTNKSQNYLLNCFNISLPAGRFITENNPKVADREITFLIVQNLKKIIL
jgi:hypothetical protein